MSDNIKLGQIKAIFRPLAINSSDKVRLIDFTPNSRVQTELRSRLCAWDFNGNKLNHGRWLIDKQFCDIFSRFFPPSRENQFAVILVFLLPSTKWLFLWGYVERNAEQSLLWIAEKLIKQLWLTMMKVFSLSFVGEIFTPGKKFSFKLWKDWGCKYHQKARVQGNDKIFALFSSHAYFTSKLVFGPFFASFKTFKTFFILNLHGYLCVSSLPFLVTLITNLISANITWTIHVEILFKPCRCNVSTLNDLTNSSLCEAGTWMKRITSR